MECPPRYWVTGGGHSIYMSRLRSVLLALVPWLFVARGTAAQDFLLMARSAAERGSMDSALTLLGRAVEKEPNRAEAHFWLAQVAGTEASHRWAVSAFFLAKRSKREFLRAVQLDPTNPRYLEGLGRYLARAPGIVGGDRDSAKALAMNLMRLDRMRATSLLVELLWRSRAPGNRERADSLVEAFAANPSGGREGQIRLAMFLSRSGKPERALPIAERLVAEDSVDAVGRWVLGGTLVTLRRDPRAAARHLRWALDHPPPVTTDGRQYWPPAVWYTLGRAYAALGRADSARSSYAEALKLEPRFRPAKASMDSLTLR
jgi:tetratricopeptide (TPR) repeat protein